MTTKAITAKALENDLIARLKHAIELDVEVVAYDFQPKANRMVCYFYMRNGFIIEGVVFALVDTLGNREKARKTALEKLILIEQYVLADTLYQKAEQDNIKKLGGYK